MKKILVVAALSAVVATIAYAGPQPGTGVINSPHDMNVVTGLTPDNQGRACAFCHTPHHAVDLAGQYNPLWSHQPTALVGAQPYTSPTFDAENNGALIDPLIGPSRLCMSCHDGAIAPDQHYGSANVAPTGRFASDEFPPYPASGPKNIAIGLGDNFSNDHPIGFDVNQSISTDNEIFPDVVSTRTWLIGGVAGSKLIKDALHQETFGAGNAQYMTCATCHDVHNKDNVANTAATQYDANHVDTENQNYFVFAPQSGSQLCISCHDK